MGWDGEVGMKLLKFLLDSLRNFEALPSRQKTLLLNTVEAGIHRHILMPHHRVLATSAVLLGPRYCSWPLCPPLDLTAPVQNSSIQGVLSASIW